MNLNNEKNKQIIKIISFILASLLMFLILILPILNEIKKITKEIDAERKIWEQRINLSFNSKRIKEDLEETEKNLPKLNSIYVREGEELGMINFIESIALKNNLKLDLKPNFNITKTEQEPIKLSINIMAEGTFNDLYKFVRDLDASPFYFITEQFSFSKSQNELITLTINGYAYFTK